MLARKHRGVGTRGRARRALFAGLFLALLVSLPSPSAAQVITFSSASASWRDAQDNVPGSQPGDPVITNGVPTSSVSWGGSTPQSGYDVTITIPDPTQFPVADFTHRNFPVSPPSLTSIVLDIVIDFEVDGIALGPLTFTFTFTHEETPNNLDPCPYPTPPGEGCTDRVTFLDAPLPTTFTVGGKTYTLGLTFLDGMGNPVEEFISSEGGVANTADLDVQFELVPPVFEVVKSGPATLAPGEAGVFTIDAQNTGPNDAWNTTFLDVLPDGAMGGMCDATPQVLSAQVFESNGTTPVPGKGPLLQGADFTLSYAAAPTCELTLTMLSAASVVSEDERLIIRYQTQLDAGTQFGQMLMNVAGATEWFDDDVSNPLRGTYTEVLSDGTMGVLDHEDEHTLTTGQLDYLFEKTVVDPVSGLPLTTVNPGDTIRYRLRIENRTTTPLVGLGFTDEIDRLNTPDLFAPDSLVLVTVPVGADASATDPNGGVAGTGLLDIRDISVPASGSELVEYDVTLVNPIADGTLVTDQAELLIANGPFGLSDDPGVNGAADPFVPGDEDPTVVQIAAVQAFRVEKVSTDLDGDPAVLLAGERLRYTITVVNVGNSDAVDATLRDAIPVGTTYVPDSTTLNGTPVADAAAGLAPFVGGMPIQAAGALSPGSMPADPSAAAANVATLVFEVVVDPGAVDGTVISNQAFVSALLGGVSDQPSDDPGTPLADDPTRDVVGNAPLLFAAKTVTISDDQGTIGIVDPDDELLYTITVFNTGAVPATGATLTDPVPADTAYVPDSVLLNGLAVPDAPGGVSPLVAGIDVSSSDLTPPLPGPGLGVLQPGQTAEVEFRVVVGGTVPTGTIISNQAVVGSVELPDLPSDGDGNPATGPEPTVVVVGAAQQLLVTKQVSVVGGGAALAGGELEYVVTVQNVAPVPASDVLITDDLPPEISLVPGSATLNGLLAGVSEAAPLVAADYGTAYGPLASGASAVLRFRATIDPALPLGTTITNTGVVTWNAATQMASASVSIDVGGMPGIGILNGRLWHDADFDLVADTGERVLAGWTVALLRNGVPLVSVLSDATGSYTISSVPPNDTSGDAYALRFTAPGAGATTAALGVADSVFTNALQEIRDVVVPSGANLQDLNLPIAPNGVVYDVLLRAPIPGATLGLLAAGSGIALPATCFDDPAQQGQVTLADGYYRFDLNFSCPSGGAYLLSITPPPTGYVAGVSQIVAPLTDAFTPAFSVPACPGGVNDAVPATAQHCEVQPQELAPPASVPAGTPGTNYHLHLSLDDTQVPGSSQIFNNHVPLDPVLDDAVGVTKTTPLVNVSRGQLVPYEISFSNQLGTDFPDLSIVDRIPAGFHYVEKSAQLDGTALEPTVDGRELLFADVGLGSSERRSLRLLLAVGAGVSEGEYVNRAFAIRSGTGEALSGQATATVRVVPDPTFDCTDVIGRVFDDGNRNGVQDGGERGLPGVRLVTPRGLVATTDPHGRFHITCPVVPREDRGSNFVLKLDDRSLPTGYRMSTRQTQVKRATRGKALRFDFGASIHRVVAMDVADAAFEPDGVEIRAQWRPRIDMLIEELRKGPAVLRLSYVAELEDERLVERRQAAVEALIADVWAEDDDAYDLVIETEIYWRRGGPVEPSPVRSDDGASLDASLPAVSAGPPVVEERLGEAVERQLPGDGAFTPWTQDPEVLERRAGDRLEEREVVAQDVKTVKLTNVVPAIRFASGVANIPPSSIQKLREVLGDMQHLNNVRLHLIGHTDDQPLSGNLARIYGDNAGLAKERAGEVAEFVQQALGLPPDAISFEWAGDTRPVASNATEAGRARNRRVEVEVWHDEITERSAVEEFVVSEEIKRVKVCRLETVCKLRYREGHAHRARIKNLVPPHHYGAETVGVNGDFVRQIRQALQNLRDETNVTVRFVGHTDDVPLTGRDERIFGTHLSLSKARARRVALAVREALDLPSSAVESDGRGASRPAASNDTAKGRDLNRRVEVEFWHDDPLQELPDEPQLCPDAAGAERVTKVYDPPWGRLAPVPIEDGRADIPHGYADDLRRAMEEVADETNVRLRFVGYTGNERLDRRTALAYEDDIGLSAARARKVMRVVREELDLSEEQTEHEGRGFVHSNDVVNAGFLQDQSSYVVVQVVYDELAALDDYEGVDVTPITRELQIVDPLALNLMRITVDGEPVDDPRRSSADVQRCTDVALERADVDFRFDGLESTPRLSVTAAPTSVPVERSGEGVVATQPVRFRAYSNYGHFIERLEVRLFEASQSIASEPLAVLPIEADGLASWQPELAHFPSPVLPLHFVVRAYDAEGRFDETAPQQLWMITGGAPAQPATEQELERALLAGYGESEPASRGIPLDDAGSVRVRGRGVPPGHEVWLAGASVPVDDAGDFVAEAVLPAGLHTVEVAVLDPEGNGELFLRDLEIEKSEWFYMGIADLTLSASKTSGPMGQLEGEDKPYDTDSFADGRLAFYVDGKFGDDWKLTASADTREGEVTDLFTNFLDKSPDALFRRIDPDYHYPTFGDDGTVEETAPTSGKLYVRLDKDASHAMWGNFDVAYVDNEIAQVDRGLYGANVRYQSLAATTLGDERVVLDGYAALPGTVPSREQFRGTGGSLYFLRRQDLLMGSERLRVEVRDKDSGLVTAVSHLQSGLDYDIDYLQGRILLAEPIGATADDDLLVRSQGLSGDEVWLVVQYEYTPSFDELDALAFGGQAGVWLNDFMKVGATASKNDEEGTESSLYAGDLTLRKSAASWLKVQVGRSEGLVSSTQTSNDGGFRFTGVGAPVSEGDEALAYRADLSLGFGDLFEGAKGRVSVYGQRLEAGYSAPGLTALVDTDTYGGVLETPLTRVLQLRAKADHQVEKDGLETTAAEADVDYALTDEFSVGGGVRHERRSDESSFAAATQEEGDRTDGVVQVDFDPGGRWRTYAFGQATLAKTGDREANNRGGVGGAYRVTERVSLDGEVSHGDLGPAVKLGTSYQQSEHTHRYMSYTLENERAEGGAHRRRGTLISGARTRLSDSGSVYMEDRYQHTDESNGLLKSMGMTLTPAEHWSFGGNWELGTLFDRRTNAETKRRAGGGSVGYGRDGLSFSGGIEYRFDETEQLDGSWSKRTTWLFRNNMKYQLTPSARLLAKYNHSFSDSSLGDFYDGGFIEAVSGVAYRPVDHDRLDVLAKYTYFYNVPTTDQVSAQNTPVEFIQKSHVASLDLTYDLTSYLTLGGKYAYRRGEVSLDREDPDFFRNDAHLAIVRGDLRFLKNWESSVEGRLLELPDLDERKSGALLTLYRYFGEHFKVGIGYNFTDFSDDLTDLSYDDHGVFFNLVGTL